MYITEGEKIKGILENGAKTVLSLEDRVLNELAEWEQSPARADMLEGNAYYRHETGQNGVQSGLFRQLTKQKLDYLLAKPFSVETENARYADLLNNAMQADFRAGLKRCGVQAITKGIGWMQAYFADGRLCFAVIPSEEVVPLWQDAAHTEPVAIIRSYYQTEYAGAQKTRVNHVEYWDKNGVRRWIREGSRLLADVEKGEVGFHFTWNGKGCNWNRVPFIPFKYNEDELPLLKGLKGAIDDYDSQKNTMASLLRSVPQFVYVLKNYGGQDLERFLADLSRNRAILVDGDGGVDKLAADINIAAYDTYMCQARKDIFACGRGVDTQSLDLGNASGQALKFRYADLDNDCNDLENEFQAALQRVVWFLSRAFQMQGLGDFSSLAVRFVFNRDIVINEQEAVSMCVASSGILSKETVLQNHPWVANAAEEAKKTERENEKGGKKRVQSTGVAGEAAGEGD